jgi:undecaprenyl-diphosphatase
MAFFAMLLVLACFARRARLRLSATAAVAVVFVVGASRIYLGAHWFTDVLGGYALGGAWVSLLTAVCLTITLRHRDGTDRINACGGS